MPLKNNVQLLSVFFMAKQSGLHQISGKVGGYSYYRQSAVNQGLIRRINEAMSGRVKTGDEYANTRLNNAEFAAAAADAKSLVSLITPKFRPMILPFSQSKITKDLLALIKQVDGNWGQRQLVATQGSLIIEAVNKLQKVNFADLFGYMTLEEGSETGTINAILHFPENHREYWTGFGIDGIDIRQSVVVVGFGQYSSVIGKYIGNAENRVSISTTVMWNASVQPGLDIDTFEYESPIGSNLPAGFESIRVLTSVCMPYRNVNGQKHILQEYCSFNQTLFAL